MFTTKIAVAKVRKLQVMHWSTIN